MRRILFAALVVACTAGYSNAVLINFDNLAVGNIDGVNLGGVTLTSPDGSTRVVTPPNDQSVGYVSPFNSVTNNGFLRVNVLSMTFDVLQSLVTVTAGDRGGDTDQFALRAFDINNVFLGSVTSPVYGGNVVDPNVMADNFTLSLNFPGMKRVEVESLINAGVGIDDLIFDEQVVAVPEPVTAGLGLLALAGLGLAASRRGQR